MPLSWEELERARKKEKREAFLVEPDEALKRLEKEGDLFAPVLKLKQKIPAKFEKLIVDYQPVSSSDTNGGSRPKAKTRLKGLGDHSIKGVRGQA